MLTFDPIAHAYKWDGQPVPGVTSVLKPLVNFSMVPADKLELARQKGIATHRMIELHAKGDLDVESLPDWLRPTLSEWERFVEVTGLTVLASEKKVYHPTYRYAGTLDLKVHVASKGVGLIDIKRSLMAGPVTGLQTAAYQEADKCDKEQPATWRAALRLNEKQRFQLEPFEDKTDFSVFLAMLTTQRFRERHNL